MCGITSYIGKEEALPHLLNGLERLEYRGYDSAGVAVQHSGEIEVLKTAGKVAALRALSGQKKIPGTLGIAHTRWATHGAPADINAHPHTSKNGLVLVHNGVIENHRTLRKQLEDEGYEFASETDTEVLVQWIDKFYFDNTSLTLEEAVREALRFVEGAYALSLISPEDKDVLLVAANSSPLVIGIASDGFMAASDASPLVGVCTETFPLEDKSMVVFRDGTYKVTSLHDGQALSPDIETLQLNLDEISKKGYPHFMLKEIMEQPISILETMRGRIDPDTGEVVLGGLSDHTIQDRLKQIDRITLVGCGTSFYAGQVAAFLFRKYLGIDAKCVDAAEYCYSHPIITKGDVVFAISQSGETKDTLAAVEIAKEKGALVLGVVNVVGSRISRETDAGVYLHAGPEIGVASTKAFTSQITVLTMITILMANLRGVASGETRELAKALYAVPDAVSTILEMTEEVKRVAQEFTQAHNFLYLGRGIDLFVAQEGALKLTEVSYIHAEGMSASSMKHGPIALVDKDLSILFVAPKGTAQYSKLITNVHEAGSRGGKFIGVITEGDEEAKSLTDFAITIPEIHPDVAPLVSVIPLQLFAYHVATLRGNDVDQPRNLAKAVTVE